MPEILFKKAATNIVMAKFAIMQDDDYFVQQAAWHVQQAIEKDMKAVLEYLGKSYKRVNHIDTLLEEIPNYPDIFSETTVSTIKMSADTLRFWESEVRYDTSYMAKRNIVLQLLKLSEQVHHEVAFLIEEVFVLSEEEVNPKPTISRLNLE